MPEQLDVLRFRDVNLSQLDHLLTAYQLTLIQHEPAAVIPGSYWGESEAGLVRNALHVRADTPVHSLLHEACHYVCMDPSRREQLHRDAGGDYAEENAVCYLQIILADELTACRRTRMWHDMDVWGYTFRLGSAQRWFEEDAGDARAWLVVHDVLDEQQRPTWRCRR